MYIQVKAKDEDNNIVLEGKLNQQELSFLLQFAINNLMAAGVEFCVGDEEPEDEDEMRFNFPEGMDPTIN
jgi:hypothetical protein